MKETWRKNCNCESTSTAGKLRAVQTKTSYGCSVNFIFYPQWSCDKCGKPWEWIKHDASNEVNEQ